APGSRGTPTSRPAPCNGRRSCGRGDRTDSGAPGRCSTATPPYSLPPCSRWPPANWGGPAPSRCRGRCTPPAGRSIRAAGTRGSTRSRYSTHSRRRAGGRVSSPSSSSRGCWATNPGSGRRAEKRAVAPRSPPALPAQARQRPVRRDGVQAAVRDGRQGAPGRRQDGTVVGPDPAAGDDLAVGVHAARRGARQRRIAEGVHPVQAEAGGVVAPLVVVHERPVVVPDHWVAVGHRALEPEDGVAQEVPAVHTVRPVAVI